jgi:hypothetical protein
MSQTKPRAAVASLQPRSIPSVVARPRHEEAGDHTAVDARPVPARLSPGSAQQHRGRGPDPAPPSRTPKASTPPPNVIPFTKPRAIAVLAASTPGAVAMAPNGALADQPNTVKPTPRAPAPGAATRVATGWTPPRGVPATRAQAPAVQVQVKSPQPPTWAAPHLMSMPQQQPMNQQAAMPVHAPMIAPPPPPVVVAPAPQHPAPQTHSNHTAQPAPWSQYEQLGLGAPKLGAQRAAKWLVSAYRMLGFSILTIIVVVLIGYIVSTAFFYMSSSWIVPMAVTTSDEKVVSLQGQLAEQQNQRDRISDELNQAERAIAAQQMFQAEFSKAIKGDLEGRKSALGRMRQLASAAAGTRAAIQSQNRAYAGAARKRMADEYAAGMIDRTAMLNGKFQLAQISGSNLSLAERQAEYETRAAELEATTRSLDSILTNAETTGDTALSYEVLQIKQQYEASRLELAKAIEMRDTLKASLARQDTILASLEASAYLRAVKDKATVAFVPYANLSKVKKGSSVYGCTLTMIFCHHIGEVLEVLPGEVSGRHPHRDKSLRGQLVELKLDDEDAEASTDDVLFVGGRPLLF